MNGAQSLVRTLVDSGVDVCFMNPGTSEMHFVAALDQVPEMRGVLALFEGVVTGAADGGERLNRFLARRGVASRRAADELIAAGRVRVNGERTAVGARVDPGADIVTVDRRRIAAELPGSVTLALNKPVGVITTMRDPQGRPTVAGLRMRTPSSAPPPSSMRQKRM